jgi:hypothetical protein
MSPQFQGALKPEFEQRKREIVINTSDDEKDEFRGIKTHSNFVL